MIETLRWCLKPFKALFRISSPSGSHGTQAQGTPECKSLPPRWKSKCSWLLWTSSRESDSHIHRVSDIGVGYIPASHWRFDQILLASSSLKMLRTYHCLGHKFQLLYQIFRCLKQFHLAMAIKPRILTLLNSEVWT